MSLGAAQAQGKRRRRTPHLERETIGRSSACPCRAIFDSVSGFRRCRQYGSSKRAGAARRSNRFAPPQTRLLPTLRADAHEELHADGLQSAPSRRAVCDHCCGPPWLSAPLLSPRASSALASPKLTRPRETRSREPSRPSCAQALDDARRLRRCAARADGARRPST